MTRPYPFIARRTDGQLARTGSSLANLCSAFNCATSPSLPMLDTEHARARQMARAIRRRMERLGYREGRDYRELSTGALWPQVSRR
jgi:hypothetical protein